jgi:SMC interacting uncharacterized protein involved in chromosome segregation
MSVDPMPIGNRRYLDICTRNLRSFLLANNFTARALKESFWDGSIQEDLLVVAGFLANLVDPHITKINTKDDFRTLLQYLKYPFPVGMTSAFDLQTNHYWFATLVWFADLLAYEQRLKTADYFKVLSNESHPTTGLNYKFYEETKASYKDFLGGLEFKSLEKAVSRDTNTLRDDIIAENELLKNIDFEAEINEKSHAELIAILRELKFKNIMAVNNCAMMTNKASSLKVLTADLKSEIARQLSVFPVQNTLPNSFQVLLRHF